MTHYGLVDDSEGTNWGSGQNTAKVYQQPVAGAGGNQPWPISPNNSEGNYLVFDGLSGSSFTLDFTGGNTDSTASRAVINGIQIVEVPEPGVMALAGLGGLLFLRRRR